MTGFSAQLVILNMIKGVSVCSGHTPQAAHTCTDLERLSNMVRGNPESGTDHSLKDVSA